MKKEEYVTFPQQPYSYSCHQQPLHQQQQQHKVDINALQMEVEELRFLVGGEPRCYSCGRISRRIMEDLKILNMHIMETMERLYKALHENSFDEEAYSQLAKCVLAALILFNRRRSGEVEKLLLSTVKAAGKYYYWETHAKGVCAR